MKSRRETFSREKSTEIEYLSGSYLQVLSFNRILGWVGREKGEEAKNFFIILGRRKR